MRLVSSGRLAVLVATALLTFASVIAASPAVAAACPDAEVVFARGREEPPGLGQIGDALVGALQGKTRMSVGAYGVN